MSRRLSVLWFCCALLTSAIFLSTEVAFGQPGSGVLTGTVVDQTTNRPVAGATVVFLGDGRALSTDTAGAFRFDKLPTGLLRFLVRAPGFPSAGVVMAFAKGDRLTRVVALDSSAAAATRVGAAEPSRAAPSTTGAQALPTVSVDADPGLGPRFADFERRRRTGAGHYLVRADLEAMGANSLQDAMRGLRGVTMDCGGGLGCSIRMVRAPMQCRPEYIVDNQVNNDFGPNVPIRDIEALEVYTGPSDVPGEYAGRNAGCGVVVIWTRAGPARRKK